MKMRELLNNHPAFPGYDWSTFFQHLHHKEIRKGDSLIQKGMIEQSLYFLEEGIVRHYVERGEKEITFDFAFPGSFFCAFTSFLTGEPVKYSIQALSDCSIYFISKQALEALYQKDPQGVWMGKWAAEQQFMKKSAREFSLLTQTAKERYQALLQSQPVLLQHIPLKYLASYIGITPQALSRIRKRIAR